MEALLKFLNQNLIVFAASLLILKKIIKQFVSIRSSIPNFDMNKLFRNLMVFIYFAYIPLLLAISSFVESNLIVFYKCMVAIVGAMLLRYIFNNGEAHLGQVEIMYHSLQFKYKAAVSEIILVAVFFAFTVIMFRYLIVSIAPLF